MTDLSRAARYLFVGIEMENELPGKSAAEVADLLRTLVRDPAEWGLFPPGAEEVLVEAIERLAGNRPMEGDPDG